MRKWRSFALLFVCLFAHSFVRSLSTDNRTHVDNRPTETLNILKFETAHYNRFQNRYLQELNRNVSHFLRVIVCVCVCFRQDLLQKNLLNLIVLLFSHSNDDIPFRHTYRIRWNNNNALNLHKKHTHTYTNTNLCNLCELVSSVKSFPFSKQNQTEQKKMFVFTRKIPDFKWLTSNLHSSLLSFSCFISPRDSRRGALNTRNINLCTKILGKFESFNLSFLVWAFCFHNMCVYARVVFFSSPHFPLSH